MGRWLTGAAAIVRWVLVATWVRYGQMADKGTCHSWVGSGSCLDEVWTVDGGSCYGGYDRQVTAAVGIVWWVPANPSAMTLHICTVTSIGLCLISTQWCPDFNFQPT